MFKFEIGQEVFVIELGEIKTVTARLIDERIDKTYVIYELDRKSLAMEKDLKDAGELTMCQKDFDKILNQLKRN